jgi:two-component system CheB/CheR fusion protein
MQVSPRTCHALTDAATANAADRRAWLHLSGAGHRSAAISGNSPTIFVVDDDVTIRNTVRDLLEDHGYAVACFADGPTFLRASPAGLRGCLLVDALMPGMSGIELLGQLKTSGIALPAIMMSANPEFHMAVQAMKAGALDFVEKPFKSELHFGAVAAALKQTEAVIGRSDYRKDAARRVSSLTKRQHEILDLVVAGHPTKNIAADLHISQRTVDNHRAAIARKTCSKSLPALIQTAVCANCSIHAQHQEPSARSDLDRRTDGSGVLH